MIITSGSALQNKTYSPITNLAVNGNFVDTSWWSNIFETFTVSGNEATLLATATNKLLNKILVGIVGHKYYVGTYIKTTSNLVSLYAAGAQIHAQGTGVYEHIYRYFTCASTTLNCGIFELSTADFGIINVKKFMIVDITAAFGAGNEPTEKGLLEYLSSYTDYWFDATTNVALPLATMAYIKKSYESAPYQLDTGENIQTVIASGAKVISLNPNNTYSFNGITLLSGITIIGNGATITSPDTTAPIFTLTNLVNVKISDIKFVGATASPDNAASIVTDIAIKTYTGNNIVIKDCNFDNFLGAGIAMDVANEACQVLNNRFTYCYYGFITWRGAYSCTSQNIFRHCRCAIWGISGNWQYTDNIAVWCRAGFVSTVATTDMVPITTTNSQHGQISGNIFNHCIAGQAWNTANYLIGGVDYEGMWFDGASSSIPPLYTANTSYYSNFNYLNSAASTLAVWKLTGCTFDWLTITSDVNGALELSGCTEGSTLTKVNVA